MPKMRLDFIFTSSNLLNTNNYFQHFKKQSTNRLIAAGVEKSDITYELSDHFPVYLSWYEENDPFNVNNNKLAN